MSKLPDINAAQEAAIARNDIVIQVSKMIDPSAFAVWYHGTAPCAVPVKPDARKRYKQAAAISLAGQILKFAATFSQDDLKRHLADSEIAGWRLLIGGAVDNGMLRDLVEEKHGIRRPVAGSAG